MSNQLKDFSKSIINNQIRALARKGLIEEWLDK